MKTYQWRYRFSHFDIQMMDCFGCLALASVHTLNFVSHMSVIVLFS
jgi:hypothetical protein